MFDIFCRKEVKASVIYAMGGIPGNTALSRTCLGILSFPLVSCCAFTSCSLFKSSRCLSNSSFCLKSFSCCGSVFLWHVNTPDPCFLRMYIILSIIVPFYSYNTYFITRAFFYLFREQLISHLLSKLLTSNTCHLDCRHKIIPKIQIQEKIFQNKIHLISNVIYGKFAMNQ